MDGSSVRAFIWMNRLYIPAFTDGSRGRGMLRTRNGCTRVLLRACGRKGEVTMNRASIALSFSRVALLAIFVWQLLQSSAGNAAALLALSGAVGFAQGCLAQRLRVDHYVAQVLDPTVDKLTQALACVLLALQNPSYWWVFVAVMGRDLVALALGVYLLMNGIRTDGAAWVERSCSLLFYIALAPLLMNLRQPPWLQSAALAAVVFSAVVGGLCYLPDAFRGAWQRYRALFPKAEPERDRGIAAYGVFAIGVIPLCTIAFASQGDPLTMNLSIIGNQPGHRAWFILWGAVCAVFFVTLFMKTFEMAKYKGKLERGLMFAAGLSFIACVLTPFLPELYPRAASWHNRLAVAASTLIVIVSFLLSLHLRKVDRGLYRGAMAQWAVITCLCVFLIFSTGISGLFEVVLIISVSLLTYHILAQLTRARQKASIGGDALPTHRRTVDHP